MKLFLRVTRKGALVYSQVSAHGFIREQGFFGWSELFSKLKETDCTIEVRS